jgi:hypothetical protein
MAARHLIIDEGRHEALRLRAKALHVTEDELVRRAIDALLAEPPVAPDRRQAATEFLEAAREIAESRVGADPYRFRRDEIYEEREARWTRSQ